MKQKILKLFTFLMFIAILVVLGYLTGIYFGFIKYEGKEEVSIITLDKKNLSLKKGDSYQLIPEVFPIGIAHEPIVYESSDNSIVEVNNVSGYITAKKNGTVIVTAKINDEVYTNCEVVVSNNNIVIKKITFNSENVSLQENSTYQLRYTISPINATIHNVYFESSDESIVKVSKTGKVTAIKSGKAIVRVYTNNSNNVMDSIIVNVYKKNSSNNSNNNVNNDIKKEEVSSVKILNDDIILNVSGTIDLITEIKPSNSNQSLNYTSTDESVVKVVNGKIEALSTGEAWVIVSTINGKSDKKKVIVQDSKISVNSFNIKDDAIDLNISSVTKISYEIMPTNATNQKINWSSSNTKVAKVDANGKVEAVNEGKCVITGISSDGNYKDTVSINVNKVNNIIKETQLKLSSSKIDLKIGKSKNITYTISPSNATYQDVKWASSNESIASVSDGLIVAKKEGRALIKATTHYGIEEQVEVIVTPISVNGITLNLKNYSLYKGESVVLIPTISPTNATNKGYKWSSNNPNIAIVDQNGIVKANSEGSAIITITTNDGGFTDKCSIVVKPNIINVSSINLDKKSYSLYEGESVSLVATINPSNATNKEIYWSSSNDAIASVVNGKVTAKKSGEAYIYAKANGDEKIVDKCLIKVLEKMSEPISSSNLTSGYKFVDEYNSETLKYWIEKGTVNGKNIYASHIWVKNAYNQLRTGITNNFGTKFEESAIDILKNEISNNHLENKGIVSINSSGFVTTDISNWLYKGKNGIPEWLYTTVSPVIVYDGKVKRDFTNRVMQNPMYSVSGLMKNGYIHQYDFYDGNDIEYNKKVAKQILNDGVEYTWGYVGLLVNEWKLSTTDIAGPTNRSAICQIDKNNFIFIAGGNFTLKSLGEYLVSTYKCRYAIGLDGGSSTSLSYKKNTNSIKKTWASGRKIFDILYFKEQ